MKMFSKTKLRKSVELVNNISLQKLGLKCLEASDKELLYLQMSSRR